jgi:hypothetical protein
MNTLIARLLLIGLLVGQTQSQTPAQILDQIGVLLKQLQGLLVPAGPTVRTAADLITALKVGGPIALAPGTYLGNFTVTKPTVLSGGADAVLVPLDQLVPTLSVQASDVTVTGLTVRNGAPDRECVVVGNIAATDAATQPNRVTLDGIRVEAGAKGGHRGIALHGMNLTVKNSRVTGFWEAGRDAQAVWINNGPGPYTVENNPQLEGSGENILVGGDSIKIPNVVPSDIVIRGNTFYKPELWRTNGVTVKNSIELKIGRRVLIENNLVDGNWASGQSGTPILFTTRNQNGDNSWAVIDDVILRGNTTKRCAQGFAVSILGHDDGGKASGQTQRLLIEHNLFTDSPSGFLIGNGVAADLTIKNNTLPGIKGTFLVFYDELTPPRVKTSLTFVDNVLAQGEYGMNAGDYPYPFEPLVTFVKFTGNVIEQHPARQIRVPDGNTWVPAGGLAALLDPKTLKLLSGTAGY